MTSDLMEWMPCKAIYSSVLVHTFWVLENYIIKYRLPQACHYTLYYSSET